MLEYGYERWRVPVFLEPFVSVLPWLGAPSGYQRAIAGDWAQVLGAEVVAAPLESADVAVLPFDLEGCRGDAQLLGRARQLAAQADAAGKVVLAFCQGDIEFAAPGANCVMFRTSASRRSLGRQDVMMPAWVADPVSRVEFEVRPWREVPTVNFVGFAYPLGVDFGGPFTTATKWSKALIRALSTSVGFVDRFGRGPLYLHRAAAVAALRRAEGVDADVLLRQAMTYLDADESQLDALHLEYLQRIAASDYTLSVRGEGNYSFRLYESLAAGRPVVSVRTHDVRPCARDVAWDRLSIDVPFGKLPWLGPAIRRGHLDRREEWEELQRQCRASWREHLSAPGYFRRLARRVSTLADRGVLTPEVVAAELA